jgi:uncharacterized membrane protein YdjX (TVP38/TMEM64 family)
MSRTNQLRLLLAALVAVGIGWAWATGRLAAVRPDVVQQLVVDAGPLGPLAYLGAFALLQPVGVSAHLFVVAAGLLWAPLPALAVAQVGLMLGAMVSYGGGRAMAPEDLRERLPARAAWVERRLREGGLWPVVLTRVVFFTFFPVSALMGALRVPPWTYVVGTWLGCLPVLVAEVLLADVLGARMGFGGG